MNGMLEDISPSALITAIEDNLFAQIPFCRMLPQAEVYEGDEIKWSITCIPFPIFNSVCRARLATPQVDPMIQSIITRAEARHVPVGWWIGPQTQPADLGMHLEAHGFSHEGPISGMAIDLMTLKENDAVIPRFSTQKVCDTGLLKTMCQVCAQGFGMPDFVANAFFELFSRAGFKADSSTALLHYMGWLNDQPVATSLAILAAGVAGIYNVTTLPEARCRGIGAKMTLAPLCEARAMGYRAAILQASEMGVNVYRRLGFQEYCQLDQYVWSPALASGGTDQFFAAS